jgi:hypothetical protein
VTADEVVLENTAGQFITARAVNKTIAANGTTGAPLSIMSARAASTWYYRWLWYNAAVGLTATLDASSTAPTAPTGYSAADYKALLPGASRTDSSGSTYLLQLSTRGRRTRYVVLGGSNTPNFPIMASGAQGSILTPTWVSVGVGNFIPTGIACAIDVSLVDHSASGCAVAPNNGFGGYNNQSNPPPMLAYSSTNDINAVGLIALESGNIYYIGTTVSVLTCLGWEDNI